MHDYIIDNYGGSHGIINHGGLASALARPSSGYYKTIAGQAAALMHALIKNHPFMDGNKRTATLATLVSLDLSGVDVVGSRRQLANIDDWAEAIADNRRSQTELATYLVRRIRPKHPWADHGIYLLGPKFPPQ